MALYLNDSGASGLSGWVCVALPVCGSLLVHNVCLPLGLISEEGAGVSGCGLGTLLPQEGWPRVLVE